jgi:GT2 family glycosyltransferase
MMDADTVPHRNPLDLVEKDLDVIAFPYPVWRSDKSPPISLSLSTLDAEKGLETVSLGGEPLEILWGGTGMMLIARRVLEHPGLRVPFEYRYDENGIKTWEEDADFCEKARKAGFKIWSALSYPCSHVKELDLVKVRNAVEKWER